MLKRIKYLLFLCLVSFALGGDDFKSDFNFRALLRVKEDSIPGKVLDYLNNKVSELLNGTKVLQVLRDLKNNLLPQNNEPKIESKLEVWKLVRQYSRKSFFRVSQAHKYFSKILRISRDSSIDEEKIKSHHNKRMKTYVKELLLKTGKLNFLDKQFLLLDIIENSHRIMLIEGASIWRGMFSKLSSHKKHENKKLSGPNMNQTLSDFIKSSLIHKMHDYDNLCKKMKVCRSFPAYFDYIGDVLEQVLLMSDDKIYHFVTKSINVFKKQLDGIAMLFSTKGAHWLDKVVRKMLKLDEKQARSLFVSYKEFIRHRRFWQRDMDIKNQAVRILMDMIDKPFALTTEERVSNNNFVHNELENEFSSLLSALDQDNDGLDMESSLAHFVKYTLKRITQVWDQYTKREVITIMEILFDGDITSPETYEKLLSTGSQYVNS